MQAVDDLGEATPDGSAAFAQLLRDRPQAIVLAMSEDGRVTDRPASLGLPDRPEFQRSSGLDLLAAADHAAVLEAWHRARAEPVVTVDVHLVADPDQVVQLYFLDVRAEHGVYAAVLDAPDLDRVLESIEQVDGRRRIVGRVQRDALSRFVEVDDNASAILGWPAADLVGRNTLELLHPDDLDRAVEAWMTMRDGSGGGRVQVRLQHASGGYRWVEITNENRLDDPAVGCVVSELFDISEEMSALEAVLERERQLQRLAEALPIGICHLRLDRGVVYTNQPLRALLGPVDSVATLLAALAPDDREPVRQAIAEAIVGQESDLEVDVVAGPEVRRGELTFRALRDDAGTPSGLIVCAADVTDRNRLRSELEHKASHDALTGCLNRAAIVESIDRHLSDGRLLTMAYLDIDDFKDVNDEFGHAAGDEVLRTLALRLRRATRAEDRVGRIGGDEFVVVCPQGKEPFGAGALLERLAVALSGSVELAGQSILLEVSIGAVSTSERQVVDAEDLIDRADRAMYERKRGADEVPSPPVIAFP